MCVDESFLFGYFGLFGIVMTGSFILLLSGIKGQISFVKDNMAEAFVL